MKKKIIAGAILATFLMNTLSPIALQIDMDEFRNFIREEIEAEVGHDIEWGDEKENSIVLKVGSDEATARGEKVKLDVAPFISTGGRTFVPLRFISESLGGNVEWRPETRQVVIDGRITLELDNAMALVDGKNVKLDAVPFIVNGRTVVPVRFVSENLGYEVEWKAETREVVIRK